MTYRIVKSSSSVFNSSFSATNATSSNMTFKVQVPSQTVFSERRITLTTVDVSLRVHRPGGGAVSPAEDVLTIGRDIALKSFFFLSLSGYNVSNNKRHNHYNKYSSRT